MTARSGPLHISGADWRQAEVERVLAEIEEFRKTMPPARLEEILSARHEGHKYSYRLPSMIFHLTENGSA
jgi:hypothetical protein